jgi:hypothetical protein
MGWREPRLVTRKLANRRANARNELMESSCSMPLRCDATQEGRGAKRFGAMSDRVQQPSTSPAAFEPLLPDFARFVDQCLEAADRSPIECLNGGNLRQPASLIHVLSSYEAWRCGDYSSLFARMQAAPGPVDEREVFNAGK